MLRRPAGAAALEIGAIELPAATAGGAQIADLEERGLEGVDVLLRELGQTRDHALDASAGDGGVDRRLRLAHDGVLSLGGGGQLERSAMAMATCVRIPLRHRAA
jgi:hypothetical protein